MRKILSLILMICCLVSMVGCENSNPVVVDPNPTVCPTDPTSPPEADMQETVPPTDHVDVDIDAVEIVKSAYDQLSRVEVVRIVADRKWSDYNIDMPIYDPMEGVDSTPDGDADVSISEVLPAPSISSSDAAYNMSDQEWDLWINNYTDEFVVSRLNSEYGGMHGSFRCQLKQDCVYEGEDYKYRGYGYSWNIRGANVVKTYESTEAGYSTIFYEHLGLIPSLESLFTATISDDGLYYVITCLPITWDDFFYTKSEVVVTMYIDVDTLLFDKIVVSCDNWTETAVFQYYDDPAQISFYQQFPEEVYTNELEGSDFYHDRSECDEIFFMYLYDDVKRIVQEDIDAGYITEDNWFAAVK